LGRNPKKPRSLRSGSGILRHRKVRSRRFNGASFGGYADFDGAIFGQANFRATAFHQGASFSGVGFGDAADFHNAAFGGLAYFIGAAFGDGANFTSAVFGDYTYFIGAAFGHKSIFTGASFGDFTLFTGAALGHSADFGQAHFKGWVDFSGKPEEQWTSYSSVLELNDEARAAIETRHKEAARYGSAPDLFLKISFANARFDSEAVFSGRSFENIADFRNARFYYPPDFEGVINAARMDFTCVNLDFAPPGKLPQRAKDMRNPARLRAFRKIAEETKNHDLERDLYIEERKAERGVYLRQLWEGLRRDGWKHWTRNALRLAAHCVWIIVAWVYWALADYGRSFVRPAVALGLSGYGSYWLYRWILSPIMAKAPDIEKYKQAVQMLTLGSTVPIVGPLTIDSKVREFLLCPCGNCPAPIMPPDGYQWLVLSQNLISIILVFFIGLALRNYFKIK
jgi:hypothetical protein